MNSKLKVSAVMGLTISHCAGMIDLISLPVWIGVLVDTYHFSPRVAGQTVTLFLLAVVVSSLLVARYLTGLSQRFFAAAGFGLAGASFFLASMRSDLITLSVLHLFAGVGVGTGLSLVHGAMGRSAHPHRVFGIAGIGLGGAAAVFLGLVPHLLEQLGGLLLFRIFALIMALAACAIILAFPKIDGRVHITADAIKPRFSTSVWLTIGGVSLITLNNAMVFSFVDVIGKARGFAPEAIIHVFMALGLLNFLLIAPLAVIMEKKIAAERVVLLGPIVQILLAVIITNATGYVSWAIAAALYTGVQITTHNFAFGLLARIEKSGRAVAATPAMLMTGSAFGPVLGGFLGQSFGFGTVGIAALVIGSSAFVCYWQSCGRQRKDLVSP
jgi:predicted MFS family arabinose efflux permease